MEEKIKKDYINEKEIEIEFIFEESNEITKGIFQNYSCQCKIKHLDTKVEENLIYKDALNDISLIISSIGKKVEVELILKMN